MMIIPFVTINLVVTLASGSGLASSPDSTVSDEPHASNKLRVLLFWAVGSAPRTMDVVKRSVAQMRKSAGSDCCDVLLAHYDGTKGLANWRDADPMWYQTEVAYSETIAGFKFAILRDVYRKYGSEKWPAQYQFVWVLDEDIDLSPTDGDLALQLANSSGAFIVGPSLRQNGGKVTWKIQVPNPSCIFRFTNYVEVIAPMIRVSALQAVLEDCKSCIHDKTAWGLDGVWCNFVAQDLQVEDGSTCAILDATSVIHQNFKTLAGKYDAGNRVNRNFLGDGHGDQLDTERRYPELYVKGSDQETLRCVTKYGRLQAGEPVHKRLSNSIDKLAESTGVLTERVTVEDSVIAQHKKHHKKDGKRHEHLRDGKGHHKKSHHHHESEQ